MTFNLAELYLKTFTLDEHYWMIINLAELCTGWLWTLFLKTFNLAENYTGDIFTSWMLY